MWVLRWDRRTSRHGNDVEPTRTPSYTGGAGGHKAIGIGTYDRDSIMIIHHEEEGDELEKWDRSGTICSLKKKGSQVISCEPAYLMAPRVGLEPTT